LPEPVGSAGVLAAEASAGGAAERSAALGKRVDNAVGRNPHITNALRQRVEAERPSADAAAGASHWRGKGRKPCNSACRIAPAELDLEVEVGDVIIFASARSQAAG
jgi:hypothetical protein